MKYLNKIKKIFLNEKSNKTIKMNEKVNSNFEIYEN